MSLLSFSDLTAECLRTPVSTTVPSRPTPMVCLAPVCGSPATRKLRATVQPTEATAREILVSAPIGSSNSPRDLVSSRRRQSVR